MNHPYKYIGFFLEYHDFQESIRGLRKRPLERDIKAPHVTLEYMPAEVDESLFGKTVQIVVMGYGNDGENEGLKVGLHSSDPVLQSMIENVEVPHITIAVSSDGEPVNTRYIEFEEIEPFEITGIYGGYTNKGEVVVRGKLL